MKRLLIFVYVSLFTIPIFAQFNSEQLSFVSEKNMRFFVYFDNISQNERPEMSISITHITAPFVDVNIYVDKGGARKEKIIQERISFSSKERFFLIKYDPRKKAYQLRPIEPFNAKVQMKSKGLESVMVGVLEKGLDLGKNEIRDDYSHSQQYNEHKQFQPQSQQKQTQHQFSPQSQQPQQSQQRQIQAQPNQQQAPIQVNINVTTTEQSATRKPNIAPQTPVSVVEPETPPTPMFCSDKDFGEALDMVQAEPFDDNRIDLAKQIISSQNLKIEQLIKLANVFSFEDSKLEILKFAYDYSFEKNRYYLVNKVFKYSSSKDELNEYIKSR